MAGMMLFLLQSQAKAINKNPLSSPHAKRMRVHPFYSDFFIWRFVAFCWGKGWDLPSVPAFEVDDDHSSKAVKLWRRLCGAEEGVFLLGDRPSAILPVVGPGGVTPPFFFNSSSVSGSSQQARDHCPVLATLLFLVVTRLTVHFRGNTWFVELLASLSMHVLASYVVGSCTRRVRTGFFTLYSTALFCAAQLFLFFYQPLDYSWQPQLHLLVVTVDASHSRVVRRTSVVVDLTCLLFWVTLIFFKQRQ